MVDRAIDLGALYRARSWLFVPGDRADTLLEKAAASEADVLILDLEDAVVPGRKDAAREIVRVALARVRPEQRVVVRINAVTAPWWSADVEMAVDAGAAAVMLPKTAGSEDVERATAALAGAATRRGGAARPCAVVPIVESAAGVLHAESIAAAGGVAAVALGGEDLAADLGIVRTDAGAELQHARGQLVLACAAARCGVIDTPTLDPRDTDLVAAQAAIARALGFTGKLAIHPRQVPAINTAFEPRPEEARWARSVLGAAEEAGRSGSGIAVVDGHMVDEAVVAAARRLLSRSHGAGDDAGGRS
jgi:citrate lyase subunit beta/citryl-CoA lyase